MTVLRTHKYTVILCLTLAALHACAPVLLAQGSRAGTTDPRRTRTTDARAARTTRAVRTPRRVDYTAKIAGIEDRIAAASTLREKTDLKMELASVMGKAAISQNKPLMLAESEKIYKEVISSSRGVPQLKASNNYCAQLLRRKRPGEAVAVMKNVERTFASQPIDRKAKSRFLYNYGKALQMAGDHDGAYKALQDSMKADPRFKQAARDAAQIALDSRSESIGIPQMLELTGKQLVLFDYEGAGGNLREALVVDHWIGHKLYPQLFVQLVRYLTVADLDAKTFQAKWAPLMSRIKNNRRLGTDMRAMANQIVAIQTGRLELDLDPGSVRYTFRYWTRQEEAGTNKVVTKALSDFMKTTGDRFQDKDALDKSLACYSNAWALNPENMEAGLYMANLLLYDFQKGDRVLDPEGGILRWFIETLFSAKNDQYRRLGGDWERILKCHIILATIFEKRNHWGPPTNPSTAAFQWKYAGGALRRVSPEIRDRFTSVVNAGIVRARNQDRRYP